MYEVQRFEGYFNISLVRENGISCHLLIILITKSEVMVTQGQSIAPKS